MFWRPEAVCEARSKVYVDVRQVTGKNAMDTYIFDLSRPKLRRQVDFLFMLVKTKVTCRFLVYHDENSKGHVELWPVMVIMAITQQVFSLSH